MPYIKNDNLFLIVDEFISADQCQYLIEMMENHPEKGYSKRVYKDEYDWVDESDDTINEQEYLTWTAIDDKLYWDVCDKVSAFIERTYDVKVEVSGSGFTKLYDTTVLKGHYDSDLNYPEDKRNEITKEQYHEYCPTITALLYLNKVEGGTLDIYDITNVKTGAGRLLVFWGSKYKHGGAPFKGDRYNIVYFMTAKEPD